MKADVKRAVDYELLLRSKMMDSMVPIEIGFLVVMAGFLAIIPYNLKEGDAPVFIFFILLACGAMDSYMKVFVQTWENKEAVNVYTKFRMIPVSKDFLIRGQVFLFTRFAIRCTLVWQFLQLCMRRLAGMKLLCVETFMITIVMAAIYLLERIRLIGYAAKLKR